MIFNIQDPSSPIIIAAIHDGHQIRTELAEYLSLGESSRLREEDPFTGKWLSISKNTITTKTSRFEVDLNRPREKAVYLKPEDSWGLKVWKNKSQMNFIKGLLKNILIFILNWRKK
jgi:N-formylglutamate deformylase